MSIDDLLDLLESWQLHLRAGGKSLNTVATYGDGVRKFLRWCAATGIEPSLDQTTAKKFVVALMDDGAEAATIASRQASVRMFSAWLADEGEIEQDLLVGMKLITVKPKALKPLSDEELVRLFAACHGKSFLDRRDEALARLMAEALPRCEDTLSMTIDGTKVREGTTLIIGKGQKHRIVPFGPQTGMALDRYLRVRRTHRHADSPRFWLGDRGKTFGYDGLYRALNRRADLAGISGFHPHRLRRTGATRWLDAGGSESGLMAVAGWTSLKMLQRYTDYTKQTRATKEARGLNLGDL